MLWSVSALHEAASAGDLHVVEYLVAHGGLVNAKTRRGNTPLHLAAHEGCINVVKYLVAHGASVDAVNREGDTPLHLAAWCGRLTIAKCLVDEGKANIFMRNSAGELPYQTGRWTVAHGYLTDCAWEPILAAARKALVKLPEDIFIHMTTFLTV